MRPVRKLARSKYELRLMSRGNLGPNHEIEKSIHIYVPRNLKDRPFSPTMQHSSIDRHVESDTRFTRGMWEYKNGITIRWANDVVKMEQRDNGVHQVAATLPVRNRGDTLNNPLITSRLFSPRQGVIGFEACHHKSRFARSREPRFDLHPDAEFAPKVTSTKEHFTVESGSTTAESDAAKFGVRFNHAGKRLTELGFRSVGWVDDARFGKKYMTAQLQVGVGEKLYGFGERFGPFVKNGQRIETWNEDGGTSSEWAYKSIPMYVSNRGYAVLVDSALNVVFEVQSERTTRVNIAVEGEGIRLYVVGGDDLKQVLDRYTSLTGKPALPPPWTFGLWLTTSFTTDYDLKTVSLFLQGMKDRQIPLHTFHFDCFWMKGFQWCDFEFDQDNFPDAKAMLAEIKQKFGVKICVWINPYIAQESSLFDDADKNGYLIKNLDGSLYQTDLWQAGMGIVDFTNPQAVYWYKRCLASLIDLGVDSFKTDFGERIPCNNVMYHDGLDPVAMHNYYTFLYNKAVFSVLEEGVGKNQACLFARSATVGGQSFPVHWGGDCLSTFEAMAETLRGGLSLGLAGFGFWSHDISGFEGTAPDPAVYKRWCAFGLLSSHSRLHGSSLYRVPWNFDDESSDVLRLFTRLKLRLMPYLYHHAILAHKHGVPILRPMFLEFPQNIAAESADTQYMLGDALLVAPVFNAEGDVSFFLPAGKWYGLLDGKVRESSGSGTWVQEQHGFLSLPLLVKAGSAIVTGPDDAEEPDYDYSKNFIVSIFEIADGAAVVVPIPDSKKLGAYAGEVKVSRSGDTIEVSGGDAQFQVRVLGVEKISVEHGVDELGNALVSAKGKVTFRV